ncbi:hypothetical protein NC652_030338 [Populus alba x Populus x berolinensis]|nr:hypothetical protein NC652_030338 [Populus alba x Populus x berolinensis]
MATVTTKLPTTTTSKPSTTSTQSSWADRVRISDSSTRFTLENLPRQPAGHRLQVSEDMLLENAEQWNRCMVGFFPGYKMPYHAVNKIASRVWRQCGLENVTATANGFLIFRFTTAENMHAILEKGPWMFGGKNIILQQWHPRFQFDKNKISTLPVWIRMHGLPFPLWSKQGLSLAASMIGRPLSCDEQTYNCTRLEYVRVCVEIDATLPFVREFDIDSPLSVDPITVTVDYEWKPARCDKCMVFGHSCSSNAEIKQQPKPDKGKGITDAPVPSPPIPNDQAQTGTTTSLATSHNPSSSAPPVAHPTTQDKGKGIIPSAVSQPDPTSTNPTSTKPHIPLNTSPNLVCPQPNPQPPHAIADTVPALCINTNDASHQVPNFMDNAPCQESKMDSLGTQSESTNVDMDTTADTSSTSITAHDASPSSSPKTAKKKKGGRRNDRVGGDMQWYRHQDDFRHCIRQSELIQIPYIGPRFTWHNGQHGTHTIQKKLDWIFGNQCLLTTWPGAHSTFQPRHISDHSAMIFNLLPVSCKRQVPFKFLNLWADKDGFMDTVTSSWQTQVTGSPIYIFTTKLRLLKTALKQFHRQHTSHITSRVIQSRDAWNAAQSNLAANPTSSEAMAIERATAHHYMQLCTLIHDQGKLGNMAVSFFEQLLSTPQPPLTEDITPLYKGTISASSASTMLLPISNAEIKTTLFSIPDNKAPGPDGYNAFFFKTCWSIIGDDFIAATSKDHYIWSGHPSGTFTIDSAWELLRERKPKTAMHHILWYAGCIPRQSFILWLASIGRLNTGDRMQRMGINANTTCILCDQHVETHGHLFFQCLYSAAVWTTINNRAHIQWPSINWDQLLHWTSTAYAKKKDITHLIARLVLSTTVYFLWHERNNRVFQNAYQPTTITVEAIFQRIRVHITNMNYNGTCSLLIQDIWGLCLQA